MGVFVPGIHTVIELPDQASTNSCKAGLSGETAGMSGFCQAGCSHQRRGRKTLLTRISPALNIDRHVMLSLSQAALGSQQLGHTKAILLICQAAFMGTLSDTARGMRR